MASQVSNTTDLSSADSIQRIGMPTVRFQAFQSAELHLPSVARSHGDHEQGATALAGYSWTYDAAGRLLSFGTDGGDTVTYGYDDTHQLTEADHTAQADEAYSYDANGNRTMSGYQTDAGNRLTSDGAYNYQYDDEGHRTERTELATGAITTYTWDYRQRLTEVTFKTSAGVLTKQIAYTYDAFDRLIAKQTDATGDGTYESAERYTYDGYDIVLVSDETGALTHRYLHGPAIDQVFADERLGATVRWALADNQGTVRDWAERDSTTGTTSIVDHLDYNAYGQITAHTDPQTGQPSTEDIHYAYTGREWDADVGLYYYRARWYDPGVGRFISEDPIRFATGDPNVYRYVTNSPTNWIDPSGLEKVDPFGAGFIHWHRLFPKEFTQRLVDAGIDPGFVNSAEIMKQIVQTKEQQWQDTPRTRKQAAKRFSSFPAKHRRAIRIGKVSAKDAAAICTKIESLIAAKISQRPFDADVAQWVANLQPNIANKLTEFGLIPKKETTAPLKDKSGKLIDTRYLGPFLDEYFAKRKDVTRLRRSRMVGFADT